MTNNQIWLFVMPSFFSTCKKWFFLFERFLAFSRPVIAVCVKHVAFFVIWEAFLAIYRAVSAGLKRDFTFIVAICANSPGVSFFSGATALSSSVMAMRAIKTPERFLGIAFFKRLF